MRWSGWSRRCGLCEPLLVSRCCGVPPSSRGRPLMGNRETLTGILFVLKTGLPWSPRPWRWAVARGRPCWRRLRDWQDVGVWTASCLCSCRRRRGPSALTGAERPDT
ncbi:transposase [Azospirillum soli]|uniref:transposase n=1 Tax=Azospirillum soli TaxID=1304799 RepID=UPI003CCE6FA2